MIGYVKNQWDIANWERQNIANEIQTKQKLYINKRAEIINELRNLYIGYMIEVEFLIVDHNLKRLNSVLGEEHKMAYDLYAKHFFRKSTALPFDVKYYFSQGTSFSSRLVTLNGWYAELDLAITSLLENVQQSKTHSNKTAGSWQFVLTAVQLLPEAEQETPVPEKGDINGIINYKWANIARAINQLSAAIEELVNAMALELRPEASGDVKQKDITWKNNVDSNVLYRARTGSDKERLIIR